MMMMMSRKTIIEQVLSSKDYLSLPNRHIVTTTLNKKKHSSFGIMLYCSETDSWLLVRSKYSYAYNLFLSGMYRKTDLLTILQNMTKEELATVAGLYVGNVKLHELYRGTNFQCALERFYNIRDTLRSSLTNINAKQATPWTYPKGRLEKKESILQCAIREFSEEAGFDVNTVGTLISNSSYYEKYISFDHEVYETTCWLYVTEKEIALEKPLGDEIIERCWTKTCDLIDKISSTKYEMMQQAIQLLKNNVYMI